MADDDFGLICGICANAFDDDPSKFPRIQDKEFSHLPVHSSKCAHVLCCSCIVSQRISKCERMSDRATEKFKWLPCPFCRTGTSFNSRELIPSLVICSLLRKIRCNSRYDNTMDAFGSVAAGTSASDMIQAVRNPSPPSPSSKRRKGCTDPKTVDMLQKVILDRHTAIALERKSTSQISESQQETISELRGQVSSLVKDKRAAYRSVELAERRAHEAECQLNRLGFLVSETQHLRQQNINQQKQIIGLELYYQNPKEKLEEMQRRIDDLNLEKHRLQQNKNYHKSQSQHRRDNWIPVDNNIPADEALSKVIKSALNKVMKGKHKKSKKAAIQSAIRSLSFM